MNNVDNPHEDATFSDKADAIRSTAAFLFECITEGLHGSSAIIEAEGPINLWVQFFVVGESTDEYEGDRNFRASGELQIEVVGIEYAKSEEPLDSARLNYFVENGWEKIDCGNVQILTPNLPTVENVEAIVEFGLKALTLIYGVHSNMRWATQFVKEFD